MNHVVVTIAEREEEPQAPSSRGEREGGLRATVLQRGRTHGWPCSTQWEGQAEGPRFWKDRAKDRHEMGDVFKN